MYWLVKSIKLYTNSLLQLKTVVFSHVCEEQPLQISSENLKTDYFTHSKYPTWAAQ